MACRKCGSEWKTATGRDCQSCPHCNKLQRHTARKAGRWVEVTEQATCKNCGMRFTNVGANVGKARCCSPECSQACRKLWRKAYSADYKNGLLRGTQANKRLQLPTCKRCGQLFKRSHTGKAANLYCSKRCFFDARNAGDVEWDRTNQIKASWHRLGPYASAPSAMLMRRIAKAHAAIELAGSVLCRLAVKELARPTCENCGCPCNDGASRFCSYACNKSWRGPRQCKCGLVIELAAAFGPPPNCKSCKRESRRLQKRMYGSYRKRCRAYGGYFNKEVRPSAVFASDNWKCHVCGRKTHKVFRVDDKQSATVDHHPIPLSKGGDHDWHNVRCACFGCNSAKGNKWDGQKRMSLRH